MIHRPLLRLCAMLGISLLAACNNKTPQPAPTTANDTARPRLLSAFFGLDNGLIRRTRQICKEAPGADGMPIILSQRIPDSATTGRFELIDPTVFEVRAKSGARLTPDCATLAPALDASERHTVLLVGELGSTEDPPVEVSVVGSLPLDGGADAKGLSVEVTPLEAGPSLVLAFAAAPNQLESDCPSSTEQIVVVAWAGGVTLAEGQTEADHLGMYTVETESGELKASTLADLGDNDNYEHLCLSEATPALRVRAVAGVVLDPRGDANVETSIEVAR